MWVIRWLFFMIMVEFVVYDRGIWNSEICYERNILEICVNSFEWIVECMRVIIEIVY